LKPTPIISLLLGLLLLAGVYFANTVPPKPKAKPEQAGMANAMRPSNPIDIDSFELASKKKMAQHALGELQSVEKQLLAVKDSASMAPLFEQYGKIWQEHKQLPLAAHYFSLCAKLENSEKKLTFAAQLFLELARNEPSEALQHWEADNAIMCFEHIIKLNPNNDTAKIGLAECYFGTGVAMKGVVVLKEITNKEPDNIPANLLLGQQGLISGQFEKAKLRFETVLKKEPKNLEAMLGLAEAYKELGEKDKAVKLLENFKLLVNNPAIAKDVDAYIKTFK
jgi:lipopolysaccharide biosynthesis regulator YciM